VEISRPFSPPRGFLSVHPCGRLIINDLRRISSVRIINRSMDRILRKRLIMNASHTCTLRSRGSGYVAPKRLLEVG
jgi:hypothetical protein